MQWIERRRLSAMAISSLLAAWSSPIEAKTRSFANVGEFRAFVMAALRGRAGVTSVVADSRNPAKFKAMIGDRSLTGDVTNIFGYIKAYPDELEISVSHFLNAITEAPSARVDDSNIVAVVRTREYVSGEGSILLHEALGADLVVVYMVDRPDSMSPITLKDLPGKDLAGVRRIALNNMRRWLPKVVSDNGVGSGSLYYVEGDPMLSTGLIFLEEFWKSIERRFPRNVLIAIPRKDQLFIFNDDGSPMTRARARQLIKVTFEDNFNLLSPLLYARRNGKIVVVPD